MKQPEDKHVGNLDALIESMRDLLGVIDSQAEDEELLITAWEKCQSLLDSYRAQAANVVSHSEEERAEIQAQLQTAMRLNAIASHLVQREFERAASELAVLREAKHKLRSQVSRSADPGGSVDLAG